MTTTTTTTTTILPRTTPLVVFSRYHHRAVEVDARSGIFACQTTRSSVTGTRTWKKTPSLLSMLLFGIALRRSFFFMRQCVVSRNSFVFFCLFFSFLSSSFLWSRSFLGFPSSAATSRAIFLSLGEPQNGCENKINRAILFVCSVFINTFTNTTHFIIRAKRYSTTERERERERESEKETHGRNARKRRDRRERERGRESVVPEK